MNSGRSARRRWAVAPCQDPGPTWRNKLLPHWTNLAVLRPLCTAGSSGNAEQQAWRRLVEKNDGSSGARLVRLSGGRGTAGVQDKESKFWFCVDREPWQVSSTLRRTPPLPAFLCTHSMDLFAAPFCNVGPAPLDRPQVDLQQGPAERSGVHIVYVQLNIYIFLKLALRKRSRPLPPNERSSFRKLLRTFAKAPKRKWKWLCHTHTETRSAACVCSEWIVGKWRIWKHENLDSAADPTHSRKLLLIGERVVAAHICVMTSLFDDIMNNEITFLSVEIFDRVSFCKTVRKAKRMITHKPTKVLDWGCYVNKRIRQSFSINLFRCDIDWLSTAGK